MSEQTRNPSVQDPKAARPSEGPFAGVVGTAIGGVLGMVVLVLVVSLLERTPPKEWEELPHAVILVEQAQDLTNGAARANLARWQQELIASGLLVQGPLDYPILVPKERGKIPEAKRLDQLTDQEMIDARPYLASGGWLVGKLYSADLRRAVFRLAPPGQGTFPPGTRETLEKLLDGVRADGQTKAWIYSRALGLEDDEARSVINVEHGVQTAHVRLISNEGRLRDAAPHAKVHEAVEALRTTTPGGARIRSATSMASFAQYAAAVRFHEVGVEMRITDLPWAIGLAKSVGMPVSVSDDGKHAILEVMTDAEGADNLQVGYRIVGNLDVSKTDGVLGRMDRKRRR